MPVITGGGDTVAIPVPAVYPIPASDIRTCDTVLVVSLIKTLPVAVPIPEVGVLKNKVGAVGYPLPAEVSVTIPTPVLPPPVTNIAVAAAPTPYDVDPTPKIVSVALVIVTVGIAVYPAPAFVSNISLTEFTPFIEVVIATAVAVVPAPVGGLIVTVGILS